MRMMRAASRMRRVASCRWLVSGAPRPNDRIVTSRPRSMSDRIWLSMKVSETAG
jgi:hypothetical protein